MFMMRLTGRVSGGEGAGAACGCCRCWWRCCSHKNACGAVCVACCPHSCVRTSTAGRAACVTQVLRLHAPVLNSCSRSVSLDGCTADGCAADGCTAVSGPSTFTEYIHLVSSLARGVLGVQALWGPSARASALLCTPTVCCMLYAACCMLHAVCCMLYAAWCMVHAVCCMVHAVCCMLHAAWCTLHAVRCMLYAACCMLYGASCVDPVLIPRCTAHVGVVVLVSCHSMLYLRVQSCRKKRLRF
jgi:hypothetical protein